MGTTDFFEKKHYNVIMSMGFLANSMKTITEIFNTDAVHNVIRKRSLPVESCEPIKFLYGPGLMAAANQTVVVEGVMLTHNPISDILLRVLFGFVTTLAVQLLLKRPLWPKS